MLKTRQEIVYVLDDLCFLPPDDIATYICILVHVVNDMVVRRFLQRMARVEDVKKRDDEILEKG